MKIVYIIEWLDASRTEQYHKDVSTLKGQEPRLSINYSVGIVVEGTEEYISLMQTLTDSGWNRDIVTIPKVSIKAYLTQSELEKILMEMEGEKGKAS